MVAFRLGCALFALGTVVGCREVFLKIRPGLVVEGPVESVVAIVVVYACFVDDSVGCIDELVKGKGPVAGLGVSLNLFDSAVQSLDGLVWVPIFVEALCVGSEVDGSNVSEFVEEVLDEEVNGYVFVSYVVVVVRI
jgi:hypothetical protein